MNAALYILVLQIFAETNLFTNPRNISNFLLLLCVVVVVVFFLMKENYYLNKMCQVYSSNKFGLGAEKQIS